MPLPLKTVSSTVQDLEDAFDLGPDDLRDLAKTFVEEYSAGLKEQSHPMAMIPTFVTGVPDGTETGTFLALDLGGTNLRVCEVQLMGDKTFHLRQQKYKVSEALKTGDVNVLFDYLADSVDAFLTSPSTTPAPLSPPLEGIPPSLSPAPSRPHSPTPGTRTPLPLDVTHLGLTFSFPVDQSALDSGTLLTWTKGFSATGAVGKDVVKLLQDAFDRKHLHVKCVALVNDTVGALLSRSYTSGGALLGAIFGTGTNGAYLESVSSIPKLQATHPSLYAAGGEMVVNTEWGAFASLEGQRGKLPNTVFDMKLDRESINPRKQAFEKFVSGMYLGEITRNVLLYLVDVNPYGPNALLFGGRSTKTLNAHYGFDTRVMSEVEDAYGPWDAPDSSLDVKGDEQWDEDSKERLGRVKSVLVKELGFAEDEVSLRDAAVVRRVCKFVGRRAAKLSAVAVAATLIQTRVGSLTSTQSTASSSEKSKEEPLVRQGQKIGIGFDGSLVEFYPGFKETMREGLRILVGEEVEGRVEFGMAKDGSGVGAALCALQAAKQMQAGMPTSASASA